LHVHGVYGFNLYFSVIGVFTPPLLLIGSLGVRDSTLTTPLVYITILCDIYTVAEQKKKGKTKERQKNL
jgi:hypothetical protein